jgi:carotenoid 1,2-hydratase
MNITTDSAQEVWHRLDDPGSYEWWYFDAEDELQGISVVFIWFAGFAFSPFYMRHYEEWRSRTRQDSPSPDQYSGFSFQMYENGREVVNFIREGGDGQFGHEPSGIGARFEKNSFVYDRSTDEYRLTVDFSFPARQKHVRGSFTFRPRHRYDYRRDNDCLSGREHRHQWLLSVPKADVDGELIIDSHSSGDRKGLDFSGTGYHDHNFGTMPIHEYFDRWYWGRVFAGRFDLVYYIVFFRDHGCQPMAVMMLNDNETGRQQVIEDARFQEDRFSRGVFAPAHGRRLRLESGQVGIEVTHRQVLDAGPFYLRFSSRFSLRVDGERVAGAAGISEFLEPSALQSPLMRFFTASRVWREGESSAMYRYYNFFKHQFDWLNRKKF